MPMPYGIFLDTMSFAKYNLLHGPSTLEWFIQRIKIAPTETSLERSQDVSLNRSAQA